MAEQNLLTLKKTLTPIEYSQHLHSLGDIHWRETSGMWVVTNYDLAAFILKNKAFSCDRRAFFVRRMPNIDLSLLQDFFTVVTPMMVMSDDDAHKRRRRVCYSGFQTKMIDNLRPVINKTIDKHLDGLAKNKEIDIATTLAADVPSSTLADFFAISEADRDHFRQWSYNMTHFFGGSSSYDNDAARQVNHSAQQLQSYFRDLIAKRRKNPQADFLSTLLAHQAHFGLSDDEIISQAVMMLVAGQVTTTDQFCHCLYQLLEVPTRYDALVRNPEDIPASLEEAIRLDPAVSYTFRVAREDITVGGKSITAGEVVFISNHAVNTDASKFPAPYTFNPKRKSAQHLSFGYGEHFCLGAKLGRLEMQLMLSALVTRMPSLRLHPTLAAQRAHPSLAFSGFASLPVSIA